MTKTTSKDLALVISAIKKMQNRRGAHPREISRYISSACNISENVAKRQVLAALKRGTTQGFLRETDGHYSLPTREEDFEAVATQELGLLDLACRKRKQQQRKKKAVGLCGGMKGKKRGRSRRRKSSKKSRKSRKGSSCGGKRSKSRKRKSKARKRSRKSRSKYNCGSKKSKKSRRGRSGKKGRRGKKRGKKGRDCVCPEKIKVEKKEGNKCHINLADILESDRIKNRRRSRSRTSTY